MKQPLLSWPTRSLLRTCVWLLVGIACAGGCCAAIGQDSEPKNGSDNADQPIAASQEIDQKKIISFREKLTAATDIEADDRAAVLDVVDQAAAELARSQTLTESAQSNRSIAENVQKQLAAGQEELASLAASDPAEFRDVDSLPQLESDLAARLASLQEVKGKLAALQAEAKKRSDRRRQIAELQASHAARLVEAEQQLAVEPPSGESVWMTTARNLLQLAKLQSLAVEQPALRWELARYDAEQAVDLPKLELEIVSLMQQRLEKEIESLNLQINAVRRQQARSKYEELRDFSKQLRSLEQRRLAERNAELAKENEEMVAKTMLAAEQVKQAKNQLDSQLEVERRARKRVERIGMSGATGLELRRQLSRLPNVREIRRGSAARSETMEDVESQRLDFEEALLEARSNELPPDADENDRQIQKDATEILTDVGKNYDKYFALLSELDFTENQLVAQTNSFRDFLNKHVMWIRSGDVLGLASFGEAAKSLREFFKPSFWLAIGGFLVVDAHRNPTIYVLAMLVLILLMPARYRGRRPLAEVSKLAAKPSCTDYWLTVRAALLTATIALAFPFLMFFLGLRLSSSQASDLTLVGVGRGLTATAMVFAALNLVRQTCRAEGLATCHFGWPTRVVKLLRTELIPMLYLGLPLVFITVSGSEFDSAMTGSELRRIAAVILLLMLAWTLYVVLHPKHGVLVEQFGSHPDSWLARTSGLWFWIIVGFPVVMIILVVVGFSYTANELTWKFWDTIWIGLGLVALRAMAIRALQINHRVVRIEKLRQKRELLGQETAIPGELLTIEEEQAALRSSGDQVLRILHSSLWLAGALSIWMLWSGFIPALDILDGWKLWGTTRQVLVEEPLADGQISQVTETVIEKITPLNVLQAIFYAVVTFSLVRNAPGLIEILILQRLPLDTSFKFAIAMMCRYVILIVGLLFIFNAIGLSWSKLQWLVAALTVGLGFGLQEIFGNFVSGIIILWERPVRIGDVVTLDGVSGKVSRIQMRATTISDWDRKEYIVPNKDFVTGRLLNWTRSDQVSRIVINVGVAYGSDVAKAMQVLKSVAVDHPLILSDPEPTVTFENFGNSTLDLTLRCFLPSLDQRLETISEMHLAINDLYTKAGIEIAFPQQDIHIRSMPESGSATD